MSRLAWAISSTGLLVGLAACASGLGLPPTGSVSTPRGSTNASVPLPSPSTRDPVVVGDAEEWVVFQSLADQFDRFADNDGIDHDDAIFLVRTDGTGLHRLPPEDLVGSEIRPTWSPDGRQVAFLRGHVAHEGGELWTINADGTGATLVYACTEACNTIEYPDWSPDGKAIYFYMDSNVPAEGGPPLTFEIMRYDLATNQTGPVLTREDGMSVEQARIAPDGTRVVYVRYRSLVSEVAESALFVAGLQALHERRITPWSTLPLASPDWSSNGRIVFNSYDLRNYPETTEAVNVYSINSDGSDLQQLTRYGRNDTRAAQPRWTPDGLGIVYTLVTRVASDSFGVRQLAYMDADGSNQRLLTPEAIIGTLPELRPVPSP